LYVRGGDRQWASRRVFLPLLREEKAKERPDQCERAQQLKYSGVITVELLGQYSKYLFHKYHDIEPV